MAIHAPIMGAPLRAPAIPLPPYLRDALGSVAASRETIEALIQHALDALDRCDGDPDLEDGDEDRCPAYDDEGSSRPLFFGDRHPGDPDDAEEDDPSEDDDPSGDMIEERGEAPTDNGRPLLPLLPQYGIDQSAGPINEDAAYQAFQAAPNT